MLVVDDRVVYIEVPFIRRQLFYPQRYGPSHGRNAPTIRMSQTCFIEASRGTHQSNA